MNTNDPEALQLTTSKVAGVEPEAIEDETQASRPPLPNRQRLREICWEISAGFPNHHTGNRLVFAAIHPRHGYLHWSIESARLEALKARLADRFDGARLILRVYDVTAIDFNGQNAHTFFDIQVQGLSGSAYIRIPESDRNLLAEVGFWLPDDSFHALARSGTRFFDRDRSNNVFELRGLYVGKRFEPIFPIESVLDAPMFERLAAILQQFPRRPSRIAEVETGLSPSLGGLIHRLSEKLVAFGTETEHLAPVSVFEPKLGMIKAVERQSAAVFAQLRKRHAERPFELLHCHDWSAAPVGLRARDAFGLPFVVTLHSTEYERTGGGLKGATSNAIARYERRAALESSLVVVPREGVRSSVIQRYGASPDRVAVIADVFEEEPTGFPDPRQAKSQMGLSADWPVVLFAGELSYDRGADILAEAIPTVCRDSAAHFVFAGDGPLRGELQARLNGAGIGYRCRFLGDVPAEQFEAVLLAADFVVIPARTPQNPGLAELAASFGKPVLTTQQARIQVVEHGQNGLVTHDNPGSMVWGIRELLANPLRGSMLRLLARRRAQRGPSLDTIAVEHYLLFWRVLAAEEEADYA